MKALHLDNLVGFFGTWAAPAYGFASESKRRLKGEQFDSFSVIVSFSNYQLSTLVKVELNAFETEGNSV